MAITRISEVGDMLLNELDPATAAHLAQAQENPVSPDAIDPELLTESIALVRRWLDQSSGHRQTGSVALLSKLLKDPKGLGFTVGFVDGVVRPEDTAVAAQRLRTLAQSVPTSLPVYLRVAVKLGGAVAPILPGVVVPMARWVLRSMVGHLVIDARPAKLTKALAHIVDDRTRTNLNLLGEAVLGEHEAVRRLEGVERLLARPDVDYVSVKVSSTVPPHAPWAFDHTVDQVVERLT
ncbi:MAG: hypothetical protein FWF25_06420, partial [Propionibacteriaceae bacterium]|nr:hypothetical protein [Propionibacteriaceae bacterium]